MQMLRPFRILVVDDDEDDRFLIGDALMECDIHDESVIFVEDGEEAMDFLTQGHGLLGEEHIDRACLPSLVLLDWNMPKMNGREVLEALMKSTVLKTLPVVVLTTSSQKKDVLQAYELGSRSFITKPTSFDGLVDVMRRVKDYWQGTVTLPELH